MLEQLLDERLETSVDGDGVGDMVQAIGSRAADGRIAIVAWNGTVDVTKADGSALLDREATVILDHLAAARYRLRHRRLDERHSNLVAAWDEIGGGADWPDATQWDALHRRDRLDELEPETVLTPVGGRLELHFGLPMPSVSLIELDPV